ncbi:MAG TPA: sialidase family protein [Candidatus Thermoplasmatota archaeon]|nr:sialidase family protein [Candidatus Thermoplasmatota archaeon]
MRVAVPVLLAALLAAGCLDGNGPPVDQAQPAAGADGYAVDCSIASADWGEPCLAWSSRNDSPSKTEIDLAVNPTDPLNVFVASKDMDPLASPGPCVWAVGQVTHDGGRTWSTVYVGGTLDEREPMEPLFGWRCITDPILQYTPDGRLHYSLQAYDYEPGGIETPPIGAGGFELEGGNMYTALSIDGGASFPTIELMHAGDELVIFHDFMRMGVSPASGTVFTLWNQITAVVGRIPVLSATESDGAVRPPVYLVNPSAPGMMGINAIVGTPNGAVHAFTTTSTSGQETLLRFTSDNDGESFGLPVEAFRLATMQHPDNVDYRLGTNVEVVADTSGGERHGCLHAVWADAGEDGADILARNSCDDGATWSEPSLVSSGPHEGAQFFPRVSVDGRGTVHVVYQTQAHDPAHVLVDADWARSTDGGRTWTVERLTRVPTDGNLGVHQNGGSFFGDYIGIGSSGDHTYMAFPVTVTGRTEIAVAHVRFQPAS